MLRRRLWSATLLAALAASLVAPPSMAAELPTLGHEGRWITDPSGAL